MKIHISKALLVQWKEYKALRMEELQDAPEAFATSYEEASAVDNETWMDRLTSNVYFFAWNGNDLVGMAGAEVGQKEKIKHRAEIRELYVRKPYRGKGIGKQLMEGLERELHQHYGVQKIVLYVTETQNQAKELYKRLGYREVGYLENEIKFGGKYFDEYIMEKRLK